MTEVAHTIVLTEAQALHEARLLVERAQKETWAQFSSDMDAHDAYRLGRLQEALEAAGDALFNVINIASSYFDCAMSKAAIEAWFVRNETPTTDDTIA